MAPIRRATVMVPLALVILSAAVAAQRWHASSAAQGYAEAAAQAAADAAALAGARSFLEAHDDARKARGQAIEVIRANDDDQPDIRLRPGDITVDLEQGIIRVEVEARSHPLPRALASLLGIGHGVAKATAAAEAQNVRCVETGTTAEGVVTMTCEGRVKYLRLLDESL